MRYEIQLPRRSLRTSLALGSVVGAVFLGIGGRIAMRIFALMQGREPGWTFEGSLTVVFMGAVFGSIGGFLLWLGRRLVRRAGPSAVQAFANGARGAVLDSTDRALPARPESPDRGQPHGVPAV